MLNSTIELLNTFVKLRVLDWVVSEVEALTHVNGASEPPWKVGVVDSALFFTVFVVDEFFQVVVFDLSLGAKVLQKVFYCNEAVVVLV